MTRPVSNMFYPALMGSKTPVSKLLSGDEGTPPPMEVSFI